MKRTDRVRVRGTAAGPRAIVSQPRPARPMATLRPKTPSRTSRPGPSEVHQVAPYGAGQRIDAYLSKYLPQHSRAEWQRLIESEMVTLNGVATRASARVASGDRVEIRPVAAFALLEPDPSIKLDILYED